jgi:hypothetical protein
LKWRVQFARWEWAMGKWHNRTENGRTITEASGRCRFTEGRTRGGSLPLTALIVVKIDKQPIQKYNWCSSVAFKTSI